MKKLKWNMVLLSAVYIGLGVVLLMWPAGVVSAICLLVGALVASTGVVQLFRFFTAKQRHFLSTLTLLSGLICLGMGVFLLFRADLIQTMLPVVFGLFVVFDSVVRVQNALELRRCGYSSWKGVLGLALLSVALGAVMIFNPFATVQALVMAIGVILIVEGAMNLLSMSYTAVAVKAYFKKHPEELPGRESSLDEGATVEGTAVELEPEPESEPETEPKPAEPEEATV